MLNSVENDVDLGTNGRISNLASKRPILMDVRSGMKVTLVNDEGKPLKNVDSSGDHDSEDEVESMDNKMASFLASTKLGYGTNSLLEQ
ncbi:hypothetical protein Tco_0809707 [Tanacetum coccineum]